MNIKKLLLTVALLPFVSTNYGNIDQQRLNELDTKTHELVELGKQIDEQKKVISAIKQDLESLLEEYIQQKREELSAKGFSPEALEKELKIIQAEKEAEATEFMKSFYQLPGANRNSVSLMDFFSAALDKGSKFNNADIHFASVRFLAETIILMKLLAQWETAAKKLMSITK